VPDRDPFYAKVWHSYRRDTAIILGAIALVVLLQYCFLLYSYFILKRTLTGGMTTVGILMAGVTLLVAGEWFAVATVRARQSGRMLWRTVGLVAAGIVLPIVLLYFA